MEDGLALIHGDATKDQVQVTPASFTGKTSDTIDYDGQALPNALPTIVDSDGLNEVIKAIDIELGVIAGNITTGDTDQVSNSLFDANTILKADSDDTPLALTVSEDTIVGRKSGGDIDALIPADVLSVLGITATIAQLNFVSGVTSAIQTQIDGNDTDITDLQARLPVVTADIQNVAVTNAKIANNAVSNAKLDSTLQTDITQITTNKTNITTLTNLTTINEQTIFGRRTGDSTAIGLTATQTLTLLGISVSATDINRLTGITDDVQVQIDNISDTFGNIDAFDEVTISGLTGPTSVDLTHIITAGIAFINNKRVSTSDTSHTYTASQDIYVDVDDGGTFTFLEVGNGDDAPALTTDSIRIMKVVTDVDNITGVTDLRPLDLRIDKLLGRKMDVPTGVTATLQAGGSLAAGTELFYVVTATDGTGETIQSTEVSATPTGGNLTIKIDWTTVTKAKFYRIYKRESGIYKTFKEVTAPTITLTDDGGVSFVTGFPPLFTNAYRAKLEDIGDVDGIYSGNGTVPSGTVATLTDTLEFVGDLTVTGDSVVTQHMAVGSNGAIVGSIILDISEGVTVSGATGIRLNVFSTNTTNGQTIRNIESNYSTDPAQNGTTGVIFKGDEQTFEHQLNNTVTFADVSLFESRSVIQSGTGLVTNLYHFRTGTISQSVKPTNAYGLWIGTLDGGTISAAINIEDQTGSTNNYSIITGLGRIGFGVSAPSTNVHISENNTDTVPAVEIEQLGTGDAALQFSIVGDAYAMGIDNNDSDKFKISYAAGAGTAVLGTNDRFVISLTGSIGIGTSSPGSHLHIKGTANQALQVQSDNTTSIAQIRCLNNTGATDQLAYKNHGTTASGTSFGISNNNLAVIQKEGDGNLVIGTTGTGLLVLGTNNVEALRIDSSQNVGIGASPVALTRVNIAGEGTTDATFGLVVEDSGGTDILVVRDDGRVGIKETSPLATLHIKGAGTGGGAGLIVADSTGQDILLVTDDGNIGMHTSVPTGKSVLGMKTITAPTSVALDTFVMYSADHAGSGTATFHMRNEQGHIIKLFEGAALTAEDSTAINSTYDSVEEAVLNNVRTRLGEVEARLQAHGLL